MAIIKTFNDLHVWRKAHELTLLIYSTTNNFPKHELFGLTSQTRRAAASIPTNIVEGFRRQSLKDGINFYNYADASLEELKYHLFLAKDLNYINLATYELNKNKCEEVGKSLTRWIQTQKSFLQK